MSQARTKKEACPIIALDKFILSTRDSGYKGTPSAISELVDNALQADASEIAITIGSAPDDAEHPIEISVLDNGCGMDPFTLRQALRFGGSTRFGDRSGLGRYGMGLPNSSLSQARRVIVYTWGTPDKNGQRVGGSRAQRHSKMTRPERVWTSYLDVDEIVSGEMTDIPPPRFIKPPPEECRGPSGTLVAWRRCDRLDNRRVSTIVSKLTAELGRRFRHYIWSGVQISVNGELIKAVDPLYIHPDAFVSGAQLFAEEMLYEVSADPDAPGSPTGHVRVRFSELPVHEWHKKSNDEKRRIGVSKGAGVSVVRAGREVDYGWFFMGSKRRENYDDWWRCEIQFDPILDEAFGITHTKQQIRPKPYLFEVLTTDIENTARVLNGRARKAHLAAKASEHFSEAEQLASKRDHLLDPLPAKPNKQAQERMKDLKKRHPVLRKPVERDDDDAAARYKILESSVRDTEFFSYAADGEHLVLILNPDHPFYREIYKPLEESEAPRDQQLRAKIELLLLAAARSEAAVGEDAHRSELVAQQRLAWSNTLATFLNG